MSEQNIPVTIHADLWSGTPYVKVHAGNLRAVHHARMTAAMDRLARRVWGESARSIRLTGSTYELVWVGLNPPLPAFLEGRRQASWSGHLDITDAPFDTSV